MSSSDLQPGIAAADEITPDVLGVDEAEAIVETALAAVPGAAPVIEIRKRNRRIGLWIALGWLGLLVFLAIFAGVLPFRSPTSIRLTPNHGPGLRFSEPLGSDNLGRSELSRIVFGARVSLSVSFGAVGLALLVGVPLGLIGGYFRKFADTVLDIVLSTILAFPPLIFLIAITMILTPSVRTLIFALGFSLGVPAIARVARAKTISVANLEYVTAARAMGMSGRRILFSEVLPNILPSVISFALVLAAVLVVAEGFLSFLGLGIRPPTPSWGSMIADSISQLQTYPYQMLVPASVFFFTVLAINTIGNWARAQAERRYS